MPFPVTAILDNFNRADEGPPPSAAWTSIIDSNDTGLKVFTNTCIGSAVGTNSNAWATQPGPKCEVYVTLSTLIALGQLTVLNRLTELNSFNYDGYGGKVEPGASVPGFFNWRLVRIDNQAATSLAVQSIDSTIGDAVGLESIGSAHKVYRKPVAGAWGVTTATATDSTYPNGGYIGVRMQELGWVLDDFGGGNIPSPVEGDYSLFPKAKMTEAIK